MFDIASNQKFEIFIMICIFLNMFTMCLERYDQSEKIETILMISNAIFVSIFSIECLIKFIALNWRYFKIPWNVFDFTVIILSILGFLFFLIYLN